MMMASAARDILIYFRQFIYFASSALIIAIDDFRERTRFTEAAAIAPMPLLVTRFIIYLIPSLIPVLSLRAHYWPATAMILSFDKIASTRRTDISTVPRLLYRR